MECISCTRFDGVESRKLWESRDAHERGDLLLSNNSCEPFCPSDSSGSSGFANSVPLPSAAGGGGVVAPWVARDTEPCGHGHSAGGQWLHPGPRRHSGGHVGRGGQPSGHSHAPEAAKCAGPGVLMDPRTQAFGGAAPPPKHMRSIKGASSTRTSSPPWSGGSASTLCMPPDGSKADSLWPENGRGFPDDGDGWPLQELVSSPTRVSPFLGDGCGVGLSTLPQLACFATTRPGGAARFGGWRMPLK